MDSSDERKHVKLLKKGDIKAFDDLFAMYSKKVYHFAFSFLKNKEDAEEIVQEVFLRVWEKRKTIKEYYSFKSFLFSISYNLIMDHFRSKMKDPEFIEFLSANAKVIDISSEENINYESLKEHYLNIVEKLPPKRKAIFKMNRFEGLSYKEISEQLQVSVNTIENHMAAALKFIRQNIEKEYIIALLFYFFFS